MMLKLLGVVLLLAAVYALTRLTTWTNSGSRKAGELYSTEVVVASFAIAAGIVVGAFLLAMPDVTVR